MKETIKQPSTAHSAQMLNLSLFIVLLAFFIVLSALSDYEEIKVSKVQKSIEVAFSTNPEIAEEEATEIEDPLKALKEGAAFDRINALFTAEISSFNQKVDPNNGIMRVNIDYTVFSNAVMAMGQKDLLQYPSRRAVRENVFLPTLISLIRAEIDGIPTRMEILLNIPNNPAQEQNQKPLETLSHIDKIGALGRRFTQAGLPENLINIGLKKGESDTITLIFRRQTKFSPLEGKINDRSE